jgi:hypothetical protein
VKALETVEWRLLIAQTSHCGAELPLCGGRAGFGPSGELLRQPKHVERGRMRATVVGGWVCADAQIRLLSDSIGTATWVRGEGGAVREVVRVSGCCDRGGVWVAMPCGVPAHANGDYLRSIAIPTVFVPGFPRGFDAELTASCSRRRSVGEQCER